MHPDTNVPNPPQGEGSGVTERRGEEATPQGVGRGESQWLPLTVSERQLDDDYEWGLNNPDLQHKYGGKVVVVHRRKVLGVGEDHALALEAALSEGPCPSRQQLAFVVVPEPSPGGRG